jgi:hypothetical protein
MPEDLAGKTILTQTITKDDREALHRRGAQRLITAAPEMEGRSFATNVLEGIVVALSGTRTDRMQPRQIIDWLLRAGVRPRVETLTAAETPRKAGAVS